MFPPVTVITPVMAHEVVGPLLSHNNFGSGAEKLMVPTPFNVNSSLGKNVALLLVTAIAPESVMSPAVAPVDVKLMSPEEP